MHFIPNPYLDPGSGSLIIQIAIAALLGLGVAVRASWNRIRKLLGLKQPAQEDDGVEDDQD